METQRETKQLEYFLTFKVQGLGGSTALEAPLPLSFPPRQREEPSSGLESTAVEGGPSPIWVRQTQEEGEANRHPDRGAMGLAFLGGAQ